MTEEIEIIKEEMIEINLNDKENKKENENENLIKKLNSLKDVLHRLQKLDEDSESIKMDMRDFQTLEHLLLNDRKIRIPFLGVYSSGKSSILNCLIGKDILPSEVNTCTNQGIIIRHHEDEQSILIKTKFVEKEKARYYIFEEEYIVANGDDNVKNFLIDLNKIEQHAFEGSFYILKTKVQILEDFEKIIKDKIEFIDFPGLNTKNNFFLNSILDPLINFSDSFIFVNDCDLLNTKDNIKIMKSIIDKINQRRESSYFNLSMCLFLLNKIDKDEEKKINYEKIKLKISKIFKEESKENVNLTKFSCKWYQEALEELSLKGIINKYFPIYIKHNNNKFKTFLDFLLNVYEKLYLKEMGKDENEIEDKENIISEYENINKSDNIENFINEQIKAELHLLLYEVFEKHKEDFIWNQESAKRLVKYIKQVKRNTEKLIKNKNKYINSNYEELKQTLNQILIENVKKINSEFENKLNSLSRNVYSLLAEISLKLERADDSTIEEIKKNEELEDQLSNICNDHIKCTETDFNDLINSVIETTDEITNNVEKVKQSSTKSYKEVAENHIKMLVDITTEFEKVIKNKTSSFKEKLETLVKKVEKDIENNQKIILKNDLQIFKNFFSLNHAILHGVALGVHGVAYAALGIVYGVGVSLSWGPIGWTLLGVLGAIHIGVAAVNFFTDLSQKDNRITENLENVKAQLISDLETKKFNYKEQIKKINVELINMIKKSLIRSRENFNKIMKSKDEFYFIREEFDKTFKELFN